MTQSTQPARRLARRGGAAVALAVICMGSSGLLSAQNAGVTARAGAARSAAVMRIGTAIAVDGALDEPFWQDAPTIGEFVQQEPVPKAAKPDGAMLFAVHCASCHGSDAQGGGPVAAAMKIDVPNLRMLAKHNGGAFPADEVTACIDGRKEVASHGSRVMPVWGDALMLPNDRGRSGVRARIAALVAYIEQLQDR